MFHGHSKPKDVNEYLHRFVTELNDLIENGIVIDDKRIKIKCRCFLCDAPAKSFVKYIVYHNGYFACNFCCVEGIYDDKRMAYAEFNCALRTDMSFRNQFNEEHHKGKSMLEEIQDLDMVLDFLNDYLHLILLGVQKSLLKIWTMGNDILKTEPAEFARRKRTLDTSKISFLHRTCYIEKYSIT